MEEQHIDELQLQGAPVSWPPVLAEGQELGPPRTATPQAWGGRAAFLGWRSGSGSGGGVIIIICWGEKSRLGYEEEEEEGRVRHG
ncbi:hypothetical protein E2C01_024136 [Portunus trituberculatus]|uniref:Uncharacterized protein n=1 Tax=Portunus trituberculatus TaxID=210409 RepID=A0A5B7EBX4_PORTR|nr:hypothetical protein [Portunus trituberculatus]